MRTINTLLFCKLAVALFWLIAFKQEKNGNLVTNLFFFCVSSPKHLR